jgi:hypothetical protein
MIKKILLIMILMIFLQISLDAAGALSVISLKALDLPGEHAIPAKELPEIQLITKAGESHTGKLISLEGETVALLPFPYWNLESIKIHVDDIHLIQLPQKGSKIGKGFLTGFGVGFVVAGVIGGLTSKYNFEYRWSLAGSATVGAASGALGLLIGAIVDLSTKTKCEFSRMEHTEKLATIKRIMGL